MSDETELVEFCRALHGNSLFHKVISMLQRGAIEDMLCAPQADLLQKQASANAPALLAQEIKKISEGKVRGNTD